MPSKTQYRVCNWSEYNKALMHRGSLTFWFPKDIAGKWYTTQRTGKRGASDTYADIAIVITLTIRSLFHLGLRQAQGFVESLCTMLSLPIQCPHYSRLSRRAKTLDEVPLYRTPRKGNLHLVADSSGLKVFGEGEWKVRSHGYSKRRTWIKLHIGLDPKSKEIVASVVSNVSVTDDEALPDLLEQIPEPIDVFLGDGAFDKKPCYEILHHRSINPIIPPRKNATLHPESQPLEPRNQAIQLIRQAKDEEDARRRWKINSGYHQRSLAENFFFRFKTIFGDKVKNRLFDTQACEIFLKINALNLITSIGMPISQKI